MKVLLINPSQSFLYKDTKIKAGAIYSPVLSLACIAAPLIEKGIDVKIIDLNVHETGLLYEALSDTGITFAGITFTTPLYKSAAAIAAKIKEIRPDMKLVCGGPHATSLTEEVLTRSEFDIAVISEGDFTLRDIVLSEDVSTIEGIAYIKNGNITRTAHRNKIRNLDELPYPAWHLYDIKKYCVTGLLAENNPVGWLETSRGCVFECVYCNKNIFGRGFRVKSYKRVADEIEYMQKLGFKEIHIADDGFTTNMKRAEMICDEIISRGIKIPWATMNGIRVDCVSPELLKKMKEAGCYRVYYGIESGDEQILKNINKKADLQQVIAAVKWAKQAGLEVFGFFMFGLPGETPESMKKTTEFAVTLDLDMAKAAITVPFPGTKLFIDLEANGRIKTRDWTKYNQYIPARDIYDHDLLEWDVIERYYTAFYRRFYLRPSFVIKKVIHSIKSGLFFKYVKYFLQTKW